MCNHLANVLAKHVEKGAMNIPADSNRSHLTMYRTIGLTDSYRTISDGLTGYRTRVRGPI